MNYLLDTHAVIWFITDNSVLPANSKISIQNPRNNCFVSLASLWEMAIKYSIGKLQLTSDLEALFSIIEKSGLSTLPISKKHIITSSKLELHHRDPFDRLIIAQAQAEDLSIITRDPQFEKYNIKIIWE